jgi:formylglycine-generating enzyme required for sulfatase activity
MRFSLVPPGTFLMGAPDDEKGREQRDAPQHLVTLTMGVYLGSHLVTQEQWRAVLGTTPSTHAGLDLPVENVSWDDCQAFCRKLSADLGRRYRLPTEAEWEHACRAGTTTTFWSGDTQTALKKVAWYNFGGKGAPAGPRPVGSFPPNAWGLFDMHGNMKEWCQDLLADYAEGPVSDPCAEKSEWQTRVLRGGSWRAGASVCRSACRDGWHAAGRDDNVGCRVALELA